MLRKFDVFFFEKKIDLALCTQCANVKMSGISSSVQKFLCGLVSSFDQKRLFTDSFKHVKTTALSKIELFVSLCPDYPWFDLLCVTIIHVSLPLNDTGDGGNF